MSRDVGASKGIRIVAGERRGRRLAVPPGVTVRPTGERVREAVFDVLGPVAGLRVLDLFAGSGAMGLEALSRGALHATFGEADTAAAAVLQKNIAALRYEDRTRVVPGDFTTILRRLTSPGAAGEAAFDLLFVDPPYRMLSGVMGVVVPLLPGLLAPAGLIVVEGPADVGLEGAGEVVFSRRYGNTVVTMLAEGTGDR